MDLLGCLLKYYFEVKYNDRFYKGVSCFYSFYIDSSTNGVKRLHTMGCFICDYHCYNVIITINNFNYLLTLVPFNIQLLLLFTMVPW